MHLIIATLTLVSWVSDECVNDDSIIKLVRVTCGPSFMDEPWFSVKAFSSECVKPTPELQICSNPNTLYCGLLENTQNVSIILRPHLRQSIPPSHHIRTRIHTPPSPARLIRSSPPTSLARGNRLLNHNWRTHQPERPAKMERKDCPLHNSFPSPQCGHKPGLSLFTISGLFSPSSGHHCIISSFCPGARSTVEATGPVQVLQLNSRTPSRIQRRGSRSSRQPTTNWCQRNKGTTSHQSKNNYSTFLPIHKGASPCSRIRRTDWSEGGTSRIPCH